MDDFPATDDPLVRALQRLLAAEGGHVVVADRIGVNDQSIYQIAYCKPHSKSGKPKSVGPKVRRGLDAAFPHWLDAATSTGATPAAPALPGPAEPATVAATLKRLGDLLQEADPKTRDAVAQLLMRYAQDPADGARIAQAIELLLQARGA